MNTRRALDLIAALARDEAELRGQRFLAPLAAGGRARVRMRGLVHELRVAGARPGWWLCRARDALRATALAEAAPWQRGAYLELWPALRVVLVARAAAHPSGLADWLALPLNPSDARQRFGRAGPLVVRLAEGGQPFERAVARVDGSALWYDQADRRADPWVAEALRTALAEARPEPGVPGLAPGEAAAYALLAPGPVARAEERRLREALATGGGALVGYEHVEGGLRVTWEREGRRHVVLVGPGLDVVSAGICLSGEDHHFDLTSLVGVVAEAPDYAEL